MIENAKVMDATTIDHHTTLSPEASNPENTGSNKATTSTPEIMKIIDVRSTTTSPVKEFVTVSTASPQIIQTTTQQPVTTTTRVFIPTTNPSAVRTTDSSQPYELQREFYTTTITSMTSTKSDNLLKPVIDFTTSRPYKPANHNKGKPSPHLSYNIQTEQGHSVSDNKFQREETKRPLVVLLDSDKGVSPIVNYNVQDQKPKAFRVTVPVRKVTPSNAKPFQETGGFSQRYNNINPPDTKYSLQLGENRRSGNKGGTGYLTLNACLKSFCSKYYYFMVPVVFTLKSIRYPGSIYYLTPQNLTNLLHI
jgi:hypothetical protein